LNKRISIIGCGWLGFPLAQELVKKGFAIKGSTTSKDKLELLFKAQIEAFQLRITPEGVIGNIRECLSKSDVLVLNIPPGLRRNPDANYVGQIESLIPNIEASSIQKVIFVSSTSVYADEIGFPEITEQTKPNPTSESGKQLLIVEKMLQKNPNFECTVLRFAGLYGNDRHPAKQLSGKTKLQNGEAPVNLIHLTDCINIIFEIIRQDCFGETFNACTTPHPTKASYYVSLCKDMNLALPSYDLAQESKGKIINSHKLEQLLNYKFQIKLQ